MSQPPVMIQPAFAAIDATTRAATFITTRAGGVSSGPYASLNLSFSSGDKPANVLENRRRVAGALGVLPKHLINGKQTHGIKVWQVQGTDLAQREADILVTAEPGLALLTLTADCVPLVLLDPVRQVIATVHAGWRGTLAGAATVVIAELVRRFRCSPRDILVGVGPAIRSEHYEVGPEVVQQVKKTFADNHKLLVPTQKGRAKFNLVAANIQQLTGAGVPRESITDLGVDTFTNPEKFYSSRRQRPHGVMGTGILLRP